MTTYPKLRSEVQIAPAQDRFEPPMATAVGVLCLRGREHRFERQASPLAQARLASLGAKLRRAEYGLGIVPIPKFVLCDSIGVDVFTIVKPLVRESALRDGRLPSAVGPRDNQQARARGGRCRHRDLSVRRAC